MRAYRQTNDIIFCYNKARTLLYIPHYVYVSFPLVIEYHHNNIIYRHSIDGPKLYPEPYQYSVKCRDTNHDGNQSQENKKPVLPLEG